MKRNHYYLKHNNSTNSAALIADVLLIVFIVLKLTNTIDWKWIWVISPLWIYLLIILIIEGIIHIIRFIDLIKMKRSIKNKDKNTK